MQQLIRDAPCSSGGICAFSGRVSVAVNHISAIYFIAFLPWQRIWLQIITLQLSKSTYEHRVSSWPLDKSPVFTVATRLLIADVLGFFSMQLVFLPVITICLPLQAHCVCTPVINKVIFPCRLQRGAVFLGNIVKSVQVEMLRSLPACPELCPRYRHCLNMHSSFWLWAAAQSQSTNRAKRAKLAYKLTCNV